VGLLDQIDPNFDERIKAAVDLIGRTGAQGIQLRYSDDETPIIWFAVAIWEDTKYETDAGSDPLEAVQRLCERLIDGGICTHCNRPTGLELVHIDDMPLNEFICWYQYDPELKTYRRGCEGD
jgi:hypothetical protein